MFVRVNVYGSDDEKVPILIPISKISNIYSPTNTNYSIILTTDNKKYEIADSLDSIQKQVNNS